MNQINEQSIFVLIQESNNIVSYLLFISKVKGERELEQQLQKEYLLLLLLCERIVVVVVAYISGIMLQSEGLIGNTTILSTRIALIMSVSIEGSRTYKEKEKRKRNGKKEMGWID